ncbi:hypothetical protein ACSSS7_005161 [Eimeria intestinalis]
MARRRGAPPPFQCLQHGGAPPWVTTAASARAALLLPPTRYARLPRAAEHALEPPFTGGAPQPLELPLYLWTAVCSRGAPFRLLERFGTRSRCFTGSAHMVEGGPLPTARFKGALLVVETPEAAAEACEALLDACKANTDNRSSSSGSSSNNNSSSSDDNTGSSNSGNSSISNSDSSSSSSSSSSKRRVVLGYDTEHDPSPRFSFGGPFVGPPLRVLQLGAPGVVAVFLLGPLGGLPCSVASLLQNPQIIKATQGAPLEALRLKVEFGVVARGFFCLHRASSLLQRCLSASKGPYSLLGVPGGRVAGAPQGLSLSALCALYLRERLDKQQQQSNWGGPLTEQQLMYAATDADASRRVYMALAESLGPHKMAALERCMGAPPYNGSDCDPEGAPPPFATLYYRPPDETTKVSSNK